MNSKVINPMTLEEEWKAILDKSTAIYIFGTSEVAKRLFSLIDFENRIDRFKGFIVSESAMNSNDEMTLFDYPVLVFSEKLQLSGCTVLVSLSRAYHPEVFELLSVNNDSLIIEAHKFFNIEIHKKFSEVIDYNDWIDQISQDTLLSEDQKELRRNLINLYSQNEQAFGSKIFYQSLPCLGLKGDRPTDYRFREYNIENYLSSNSEVLDIGSNCGFFDIYISDKVNSVVGIEYNGELVKIAQMAANGLSKSNIRFIRGDYKEWQKQNKSTYDVIFSFAVHVWLGVTPQEYAYQIYHILKDNGVLFFESQTMPNDKMYYTFCDQFAKSGLVKVYEGKIKDDGITPREFCVLKKMKI